MVDDRDLKVEHRISGLETSVKNIETNHLPHISANIEKLFGKMDKFTWLIITTLITVIIGLVMIFFKK